MTIKKLHELALVLAPEFKTEQLELLYPAPEHCPRNANVGAFAVRRGRSLWLRSELQKLNRWQGAFPSAIVFFEWPTVAVLIHELAHILPIMPAIADERFEATPERIEFETGMMEHYAAMPVLPAKQPWRGHGLDFIRRALCLHHRAEKLGMQVPLYECAIAGREYGLSSAFDYRDALCGFESHAERMTFAEIDSKPFLPGFEQLFENDTSEYLAANSLPIER